MFPWVYDFRWEPAHLIFLGVFFSVVTILLVSLARSILGARSLLRQGAVESIRWAEDFEDLPASSRVCRHVLNGEISQRTCPNGFDCRVCETHPTFRSASAVHTETADACAPAAEVAGIHLPTDRAYHRGHTWVKNEPDGTVTVGPDALASRLIGRHDKLDLPPVGTRLVVNGTGWRVQKGEAEVRVMSPVEGEVIEAGPQKDGSYLRVRPSTQPHDTTHLLKGSEIRPWMLREIDRLQLAMSEGPHAPQLADGGVLVDDLSTAIPDARRDEVLGEMFLEP